MSRRRPMPIARNRYGSVFGRTRKRTRYRTSKRLFANYYTHVCLRCGWAFKPPRHERHRLEDCNRVRSETKTDPKVRAFTELNLYEGQDRAPHRSRR